MSQLTRLEKLEQIIKPKVKVIVVYNADDITDEPNVLWIHINL